MKKFLMFLPLVILAGLIVAWDTAPHVDGQRSITVVAATTNIPPTFANTTYSRIMTGLSGKGYKHMIVLNETGTAVSVLSWPQLTVTDNEASTHKLRIASNGAVAWDDIALYENLFLRSESGASILTGNVTAEIW